MRLAKKLGGQSELARRCRVTPQALSDYIRGKRRPRADVEHTMIALGLDPSDAWSDKAAALPRPPPPVVEFKREGPITSRGELERTVDMLARQCLSADRDPTASWRDKSTLANALTVAVRALAKVSGDNDLTVATILRSREWTRVKGIIAKALEPFPQAGEAVSAALRQAEGM